MTHEPPKILRDLPIWLVWQYEPGGAKPRKIPYYVGGARRRGVQGSPEDKAQLATYLIAMEYADKTNMSLGIALLPGCDVTGVDYDNCVVNGVIHPEVAAMVEGTYAEFSPSGNGIHAFILGEYGNTKHLATADTWGIELFSTKGFLTWTGNLLPYATKTIEPANSAMLATIAKYTTKSTSTESITSSPTPPVGLVHPEIAGILNSIDPDCGYHEWVRVGMAIHHETQGSHEGYVLWDTWSAGGDKYQSAEYNTAKWDSFGHNPDARPVTMRSLTSKMQDHITVEPIIDTVDTEHSEPYFKALSFGQVLKMGNTSQWLIDDFLPKAGLGVIYGPSRSGKSFVALDMCAALARGVDWNGMRCHKKRNKVIYIVAEGTGGIPKRLAAYCQKEGITGEDIDIQFMMDKPLNLNKGGNAHKLVSDAKFFPNTDLIVVDTFAQVTPGMQESDSGDMGIALAYCKRIHEAYGAMVLLVHHTGKDTQRGARGHSSLTGAADVMFEVSDVDGDRAIKVSKQKDGEDSQVISFNLVMVPVGRAPLSDRDIEEGLTEGKVITSCYVDYTPMSKKGLSLRGNELVLHTILSSPDFLNGTWATEDHVISLCREQELDENGVPTKRKQVFKRVISSSVGKFVELECRNSVNYIRVKPTE